MPLQQQAEALNQSCLLRQKPVLIGRFSFCLVPYVHKTDVYLSVDSFLAFSPDKTPTGHLLKTVLRTGLLLQINNRIRKFPLKSTVFYR